MRTHLSTKSKFPDPLFLVWRCDIRSYFGLDINPPFLAPVWPCQKTNPSQNFLNDKCFISVAPIILEFTSGFGFIALVFLSKNVDEWDGHNWTS
ncbi:hypothetical protein ElyMa_004278600 [Elysia marginata]|uniref:Uncharacterized protein n=1 Tax=Elysia marginata TaxID=1093978 RepID=A0AAV4GW93_9GAST|nr:hypothetical protein ElyMa_004278600 [Elysia marginata]